MSSRLKALSLGLLLLTGCRFATSPEEVAVYRGFLYDTFNRSGESRPSSSFGDTTVRPPEFDRELVRRQLGSHGVPRATADTLLAALHQANAVTASVPALFEPSPPKPPLADRLAQALVGSATTSTVNTSKIYFSRVGFDRSHAHALLFLSNGAELGELWLLNRSESGWQPGETPILGIGDWSPNPSSQRTTTGRSPGCCR